MSTHSQPVNEATVAELKEIVGDALAEIIDAYVTDGQSLIETMASALSTEDCAQLQSISHQLKSSSANLGAMGVCELMKEIESHAKNGDASAISALFASATSEFDRVVTYFTSPA